MKKKLITIISLVVIVAAGIVSYEFFVKSKGDIFHVNTVTTDDTESHIEKNSVNNSTDEFAIESDTSEQSSESSTEKPKTDIGTAIQRVPLGKLKITMDAEYQKNDDISANDFNGFVDDCVEYDKSDGMIIAAVKSGSTFHNTSLSIVESALIDTNTYKLTGESNASYGKGDWTIHLYLTDDKSTASYIASAEINNNNTVYVLLHCKYNDKVSDTEFTDILSSIE